jgi:hypothetical protein
MHEANNTIAAIGLCLSVGFASAFDALDVRSVAELELMNKSELGMAAAHACTGVIVGKEYVKLGQSDRYRIANQYLRTIGLVLRKKNNGSFPMWYAETLKASSEDSLKPALISGNSKIAQKTSGAGRNYSHKPSAKSETER